jgi:hypothetical protein
VEKAFVPEKKGENMRFWFRELMGWVLVLLGLGIFFLAWTLCLARWIWEGGITAVMGIFVFRGGIHLLKVAAAARICLEAQDRLYPAAKKKERGPWAVNRGP